MEYTTSVPFSGTVANAIEVGRSQLIATGFKVDQPSDTELVAQGPGMHSTKQNPILGMSRAKIVVSPEAIGIRAELGGVKFMQLFAYFFPIGLGVLLSLTFLFLPNMPGEAPLMAFIPITPWLVISPLMAKWIKKRTIRSIDILLHNMASTHNSATE